MRRPVEHLKRPFQHEKTSWTCEKIISTYEKKNSWCEKTILIWKDQLNKWKDQLNMWKHHFNIWKHLNIQQQQHCNDSHCANRLGTQGRLFFFMQKIGLCRYRKLRKEIYFSWVTSCICSHLLLLLLLFLLLLLLLLVQNISSGVLQSPICCWGRLAARKWLSRPLPSCGTSPEITLWPLHFCFSDSLSALSQNL